MVLYLRSAASCVSPAGKTGMLNKPRCGMSGHGRMFHTIKRGPQDLITYAMAPLAWLLAMQGASQPQRCAEARGC
jgi:hypothetical protein